MKKIDRIGLIAGSGKFPIFLSEAAKANGVEVIAIALNSETDAAIEKAANKVYWQNLGQSKKLIDTLKAEGIKHAIMAGKISKTTIIRESLRLDKEARSLLSRVVDRRDDTLLLAVAKRLKEFDIELIDSTTFTKFMMPPKSVLTRNKPSKEQSEDIAFGFKIAKEMGRLDIGQAIAVKRKAVIAVEAIEGTDKMIERSGRLAGSGTVIVKVSKPSQDMRFDVPAIGLTTIESLKKAGSSVLAIEAEKVLVLEKEELIKEANRIGLSVVAV